GRERAARGGAASGWVGPSPPSVNPSSDAPPPCPGAWPSMSASSGPPAAEVTQTEPIPAGGLVERPTRVRYAVLAFLAAMTIVLYLDRVCIGQAAPLIKKDLGISETQKGVVF